MDEALGSRGGDPAFGIRFQWEGISNAPCDASPLGNERVSWNSVLYDREFCDEMILFWYPTKKRDFWFSVKQWCNWKSKYQ